MGSRINRAIYVNTNFLIDHRIPYNKVFDLEPRENFEGLVFLDIRVERENVYCPVMPSESRFPGRYTLHTTLSLRISFQTRNAVKKMPHRLSLIFF